MVAHTHSKIYSRPTADLCTPPWLAAAVSIEGGGCCRGGMAPPPGWRRPSVAGVRTILGLSAGGVFLWRAGCARLLCSSAP